MFLNVPSAAGRSYLMLSLSLAPDWLCNHSIWVMILRGALLVHPSLSLSLSLRPSQLSAGLYFPVPPVYTLLVAHSHNSYNFAPDVELTQFLQISQHPCMLHTTEKREKKHVLIFHINLQKKRKNKNNQKMWRIETAARKSEFFSLWWNCRCSNSIECIIILLYTV